MKRTICLTFILCLFLTGLFGQDNDTTWLGRRGCYGSNYFIDGFKVYSKMTKGDSLKILRETASQLNGYWKSTKDSYIMRFVISTKSLSGQMVTPYEKVQQAAPIPIKLAFNRIGIISLISPYDTLRITIFGEELRVEENTYCRTKIKR